MSSVKVLTWVPHEPRVEIPFEVVRRLLMGIDWDVFEEANFGYFILTLFFTFSRSECPCPKAFTGEEAWDPRKHWQVKDIWPAAWGKYFCMAVRFKALKQDPRMARPAAGGDGDISYCGDVKDSEFSLFEAYGKLMKFYPDGRDKEAPFFVARDRVRPYTYAAARADLRVHLERLDGVDPDAYALHSFRVLGFNRSQRANGSEITAAHGRWQLESAEVYFRWDQLEVLGISAGMVGVESSYSDPGQTARTVERGLLPRGQPSAGAGPSSAAEEPEGVLPAGVKVTTRSGAKLARAYKVYEHSDGHISSSIKNAWRYAGCAVAAQAALQAEQRAVTRSSATVRRAATSRPRGDDFYGVTPAAALVSVASVAPDLVDLSRHITYASRPSARPAPTPRAPLLPPPPRSPARPVCDRRN